MIGVLFLIDLLVRPLQGRLNYPVNNLLQTFDPFRVADMDFHHAILRIISC